MTHFQPIKQLCRASAPVILAEALLAFALLTPPQQARADWRSLSGGFLPAFAYTPSYEISPDSRTVAFVTDKDTDDVFELYVTPITGTMPLKLNPPLVQGGDVRGYRFTPDGQYMIYTADQEADNRYELFRVPVGGGQAVKLNPTLVPEGNVVDFKIEPDSRRVIYRADQMTDDIVELWSVPIMGVGAQVTKLSGTMLAAGGDVSFYEFDRSSGRVVFNADRETDEKFELYSAPIVGGAPLKLNPPIQAGGAESGISNFVVHPNSPGVVFHARLVGQASKRLYLVSTAGNIAPIPLNFEPAQNQVMLSYTINPTGERVVYNLATVLTSSTDKGTLYSVPIAGGDATALTDFPDPEYGADYSYRITPDGARVVYRFQKSATSPPYLASALHNGVRTPLYQPGAADPPLFNFDLSPDGQWASYQTSIDPWQRRLHTIPTGGGSATDHGVAEFKGMLPDSNRILYTRYVSITAGTNDLFSAAVSGGDERNLSGLNGAGRVTGLQVSKDSRWIVFIVEGINGYDLRVSDGNPAQPPTPTPTPTPSPVPITPAPTPAPTTRNVYVPVMIK
jgi:hypothetical protein